MSGPIRQLIGPTNKRLRDYLTKFQDPIIKIFRQRNYGRNITLFVSNSIIFNKRCLNWTNTLPHITHPLPHISPNEEDHYLSTHVDIDLLLGVDYATDLIIWRPPQKLPSGYKLFQTKMGPTIFGKGSDTSLSTNLTLNNDSSDIKQHVSSTRSQQNASNQSTQELLQKMWSLESIGISDFPHVNDDEEVMKLFKEGITFQDERYTVR